MHIREIIRTLAMMGLVLCCGLVASGRGKCTPKQGISDEPEVLSCYLSRFEVDSNSWLNWPTTTLYGQFFVVIASFILFWVIVVALTIRVFIVSKRTEIILIGICLCVTLLCAILESWYTTGFGELSKNLSASDADSVYVQSWAAAAFFYFLLTFLFGLDIFVTWRMSFDSDTASLWSQDEYFNNKNYNGNRSQPAQL